MHSPLTVILLLFVVLALLTRRRSCKPIDRHTETTPAAPADDPKPTKELANPAPPQSPAPVESKLSTDDNEQLRQALALSAEVKQLASQFGAIKARLPEITSEQADALTTARNRECIIVTEQLRIAKSNADLLMRFVMAPYQGSDGASYTPSFEDAAWALTAANLTLGFARSRIINLA